MSKNVFYFLAIVLKSCANIAAHTISDLEHETALQILGAIIGVSYTSVPLFVRMCIELLFQGHGKSSHGSSLKTMKMVKQICLILFSRCLETYWLTPWIILANHTRKKMKECQNLQLQDKRESCLSTDRT